MKILLINYEYPPIGAGAANAAWHMVRELNALGCHVHVLTSCYRGFRGLTIEDGITVHRLRALRRHQEKSSILEMGSFVLSSTFFLPRFLNKESMDASIVFFSIPCGPLGLMGRLLCNVPYVISLRGGDVPGNEPSLDAMHWALAPLRRLVLKRAFSVVANSHGLKTLSELSDPCPVQVIPNGVDTDFFSPAPTTGRMTRFLFVGRFQPQKNLFFLLDQMESLARRADAPFELHMAGDGPQRIELMGHARTHGINDMITWHGWCGRERLRELYRSCDCLVNPSFYEGMANVMLEAMACGMTVIASDVIGNRDLVEHGRTGWLFDLNKPEALQELLMRTLLNSDETRRIGEDARARVMNRYSWKNVALQYLEILNGAAAAKGTTS